LADVDTLESRLLERLRDSDPAALEALYDRYAGLAMAVAYRILGSREEAEEVVQDVFWRLWKSSIQYDPLRGQFKTWLLGICRNRAIDSLRRRDRRPRTELATPSDDVPVAPGSESAVLASERRTRIESALANLPDAQRQAIELSFYAGLTHSEIAKETGEPLGTIKSRIHGGIAKLRESLTASGVTA
jgi:RNA polymerase sigma-70 factor (ECF subfamily)